MVVEVLLYSQGSQAIQQFQAKAERVIRTQHSQGNLLPIQRLSSSVVEAVVVVLETK